MPARWWSLRALGLHAALVVWVAGCGLATWWQVGRAIGGNQYSYLYAVEWPVFALSGGFCWWRLVHSTPEATERRVRERAEVDRAQMTAYADRRDRSVEDPELAAYNDHLAALAESGKRKGWRR